MKKLVSIIQKVVISAPSFILFFTLALLISSCNKMDNVDEQQEVPSHPSGIVIIKNPESFVKGDTLDILFRVNPSNAIPTLENVHLDGFWEKPYTKFDPEIPGDPGTRSHIPAYYDALNFKIVEINPSQNEAKDTLDGEWIARIASAVDPAINCYVNSVMAFVMSYNDKSGKEQTVSSEVFPVAMLPTIEEGLDIWCQPRYSYKLVTKDTIPSAYISFDANKYKAEDDDIFTYTLSENIENISAVLDSDYTDVFTILPCQKTEQNAFLEFVPNPAHPKWAELEASVDSTMTIPGTVTIVDKHNNLLDIDFTFIYYAANTIELPLEVTTSPTVFDITQLLRQYGFYYEEFLQQKRRSIEIAEVSLDPFFTVLHFMEEEQKVEYSVNYFTTPPVIDEDYDLSKVHNTLTIQVIPDLKALRKVLEIRIRPRITYVP